MNHKGTSSTPTSTPASAPAAPAPTPAEHQRGGAVQNGPDARVGPVTARWCHQTRL